MGILNLFRKKTSDETPTVSEHSKPSASSDTSYSPIFETSYAEKCKYRYKDVKLIKCDNAHPKFRKGSIVALLNDGSHSDPSIQAVLFDDSSIGYKVIGILYPSRLEQMIADWIDRGWFIGAQISDISDTNVYLDIIMGEFESV